MAKGHCECEAINHDHDPDECHRKPSHFVLKHNGLAGDPEDWIVVYSRCLTLFRLERGQHFSFFRLKLLSRQTLESLSRFYLVLQQVTVEYNQTTTTSMFNDLS
jgi:hypothetical protein